MIVRVLVSLLVAAMPVAALAQVAATAAAPGQSSAKPSLQPPAAQAAPANPTSQVPGGGAASTVSSTDFLALMKAAIDSPKGTSSADVTGDIAKKIRDSIGVQSARVHAKASVVERFAQEGCARVAVNFTTPGTLLKMSDGSGRPLDMTMTINICKNGMPPTT